MSFDYPKHFYKYRSINESDFESDLSLDALFNSYVIFSSRINFNDPFDSKIEITSPSPKEYKFLLQSLETLHPLHKGSKIKDLVYKGNITQLGRKRINFSKNEINKLIDTYGIFSVSKDNENILLWSHYANSHKGYCIEFKSEGIEAKPIIYKNQIPTINLTEFSSTTYGEEKRNKVISEALLTKLDIWSYENEYRVIANAEQLEKIGKGIMRQYYDPCYIESIIFGSKMSTEIKQYIINKIPFKTKFKQATETNSSIIIKEYKYE